MNSENVKILRAALRGIEHELNYCVKEGSMCCCVTESQWDVLLEIGTEGNMAIVDLASKLKLDTSTLSRTVNGMVKNDLLLRIPNANDRRFVSIQLSKRGKTLLNQIDEIYNNQLKEIFKHIPESEHETVLQAFTLFSEAAFKLRKKQPKGCCQ